MIPSDFKEELYAYMATTFRGQGCDTFRIGGTNNHVHIACTLPRQMAVSDLIRKVKRTTSVWIKTKGERFSKFAWQTGYGVFSFGQSQLDDVVQYVDNQEEHHKTRSFQDEFRAFMKKYGLDFDERYLWD